jgi:hypothetical protein
VHYIRSALHVFVDRIDSRRFSIAPIALIYFRIVRLLGRSRIWFFRQEQAADLQLLTKILG